MRSTRHGFTLVELLVVIGVVAVLIAMLMPALNKARQQANQIRCGSNLRQLGIAAVAYTVDHKGQFPPDGVYVGVNFITAPGMYAGKAGVATSGYENGFADLRPLNKYFGKHFLPTSEVPICRCPSDNTPYFDLMQSFYDGAGSSYTWNCNAFADPTRSLLWGWDAWDGVSPPSPPRQMHYGIKTTQIRDSGRFVLAGDWVSYHFAWAPSALSFLQGARFWHDRQGKSFNLLFADGHVQYTQMVLGSPPGVNTAPGYTFTRK